MGPQREKVLRPRGSSNKEGPPASCRENDYLLWSLVLQKLP